MKLANMTRRLVTFGLISSLAVACGKKDEGDDEEDEDSSTVSGVGAKAGTSSASKLSDFKLSSALKLELPDSVSGSGTALRLVPSGKSHEACEIRRAIREGTEPLLAIGSMFCHLELESDTIAFGKKVAVNASDDPSRPMAIWVDDSKKAEGQITIQFCQSGKLESKITITGVGTAGVKGSMIHHGGMEAMTWGNSVVFDAGYTAADRFELASKGNFSEATSGSSYKRQLLLSLKEGDSKVVLSQKGSWMGDSFASAGAAKFGTSYGQALYKSSGTHGGQSHEWTHRAYFNAAGMNVAADASPDFADGGALSVKGADVPQFLPDDFAADAFAATDWDCITDETVDLNMTGTKAQSHQACEVPWDELQNEDCWGVEFEESATEVVLDETQLATPDAVEAQVE